MMFCASICVIQKIRSFNYLQGKQKGGVVCTSWFLEMADWMNLPEDGETQAGKIVCPTPRCGEKLGAFAHYGA